MYKASAVLILTTALFAGCSTGSTPPATSTAPSTAAATPAAAPAMPEASTGEVQKKLQEAAGNGATNCGDVKSLGGEELRNASDCALQAAKNKKAFLVSYNMPGMSVGVAGNAEGKLFTVQSAEEAGKPGAPKMSPCPAELRIAQSGRVTCMPPGSMGVLPGSGNPHAAPGATPQGGTAPAAPKAAPQKSH